MQTKSSKSNALKTVNVDGKFVSVEDVMAEIDSDSSDSDLDDDPMIFNKKNLLEGLDDDDISSGEDAKEVEKIKSSIVGARQSV